MAYIFFDLKKKQFVDDLGVRISEIGTKVKSPFNTKRQYPYLENTLDDDKIEIIFGKKEFKEITLTNEQRNKIIEIINLNSSNTFKEIKYVKTSFDYSNLKLKKKNFIIIRFSNNDILMTYLVNGVENSLIINKKGFINKGTAFSQSTLGKTHQYEEYEIIFHK